MKLKPIHKKRLEKLIAFLRQLPDERFNFGLIREERKCGAVGCAIGWTPTVFPRTVTVGRDFQPIFRKRPEHLKNTDDFYGIGIWITGMKDGYGLFQCNTQKHIHPDLPYMDDDSTREEVAGMLEKFIKLHS